MLWWRHHARYSNTRLDLKPIIHDSESTLSGNTRFCPALLISQTLMGTLQLELLYILANCVMTAYRNTHSRYYIVSKLCSIGYYTKHTRGISRTSEKPINVNTSPQHTMIKVYTKSVEFPSVASRRRGAWQDKIMPRSPTKTSSTITFRLGRWNYGTRNPYQNIDGNAMMCVAFNGSRHVEFSRVSICVIAFDSCLNTPIGAMPQVCSIFFGFF